MTILSKDIHMIFFKKKNGSIILNYYILDIYLEMHVGPLQLLFGMVPITDSSMQKTVISSCSGNSQQPDVAAPTPCLDPEGLQNVNNLTS